MSNDLESDDFSHESSINSMITEYGRNQFQPQRSEYVCHASTIPLATTFDLLYARKRSGVKLVSLFHGDTAAEPYDRCSRKSCMYTKQDGSRTNEKVPYNCPCLEIRTVNGDKLRPICFIAYVRSLNHNLADIRDEAEKNIDASRILFCQDSQGIFDNKYPGAVRDILGVTGWGHISSRNFLEVMDLLYWYRINKGKLNLDKVMRAVHDQQGFVGMKRCIKQVLHTLNGLLHKKFIVFGPELSNYSDLAYQTAVLFRDLMIEYGEKPVDILDPGITIYKELKEMFNFCKSSFYKGRQENRIEWLSWDFQAASVRVFFEKEFRRLKAFIYSRMSLQNSMYTESLAWFFRSTTFAQTRNLGYLPPVLAEVAFRKFRDIISRPLEDLSPENDRLIRVAVKERFQNASIPWKFLMEPLPGEEEILVNKIMLNIDLDLKDTASTDHKVSQGGKLEDARLVLRRIIDYGWEIPIRSLDDNSIVEILPPMLGQGEDDLNRALFWYSYQLMLNWFAERGLVSEELYYPFVLPTGKHYSQDMLRATIVHIMEPGKVRNLVKGTGEFAWFLTPAAKILQAVLALLPEHRAGLERAGHDWMHMKRVSAESDESGFIYDRDTGYTHESIRHIFKDWTESTDFIGKRVGAAHLGSMMDYIGFPKAYGELVLMAIREPQPVQEVTTYRYILDGSDEGGFESETNTWNGSIVEGYMMGMPVTKPILHLIHVSEREVTRVFLARRGITVIDGLKGPSSLYQQNRLPRKHPPNPVMDLGNFL